MTVDFPELDAALAELRFDDASDLVDGLGPEERPAAAARLRAARESATDGAELFANRIQQLARSDHYAALYALSKDPTTFRQLGLLPKEIRRGAEVHLNGAQRRREQSLGSARRQMAQARKALDTFHTGTARTALARVDTTWLGDGEKAELAELRERLELLKAETDELAARGDQVAEKHGPRPARSSRARSGCLAKVLLALGVVLAAMALSSAL